MIYLIITTSIIDRRFETPLSSQELRENQYKTGILSALNKIKGTGIIPIIVENNGKRSTFLDDFGIDVLYTDTNNSRQYYGNKELHDIFHVIKHYNIHDNDMIIKFTGRYLMTDDCFIQEIVKNSDSDCFLRFGSFFNPVNYPTSDCITGLIAMRCKYIKQIEFVPDIDASIEWSWAKVASLIGNKKIVDRLGFICYAYKQRDLIL
jgi:hypothetical protein